MLTRRSWTLAAIAGAAAGFSDARSEPVTLSQASVIGPVVRDAPFESSGRIRGSRLTAAVTVNGQGPFTFIIDTAANASMLSMEAAAQLGLSPGPTLRVNTLLGYETVQTVRAGRLRTGSIDAADRRLLLGPRDALGADGLIGLDLLRDQRLHMNFLTPRTRISAGRSSPGGYLDTGRFDVRFAARRGLRTADVLMIPVRVGRTSGIAVLDTAAQVSIINSAMAQASGSRGITLLDGARQRTVQSPTGLSAPADLVMLNVLGLGGVTLTEIPVLRGDFHVFNFWGLSDQPAMLLGVDVLKLFKRVVVDLRRQEVVLQT